MSSGTRSARVATVVALSVVVSGLASGCAKPPVAEVYPYLTEYSGREIGDVAFQNPDPFSTDSLDALTETEETFCRWLVFPFCFPGTDWGRHDRHLDLATVGGDVERLTRLYRQSGFFGTRVVPEVTEPGGDDAPIRVAFVVHRGDAVILDSVAVEGTEGIADPDSVVDVIPLQSGDRFDLREFVASADTVTSILRSRGHAYAEVLRNYGVDTLRDRATVVYVAVPGPRVVIDSIVVRGIEVLDRPTLLRQLTFEQGDLLERRELVASQRNLYDLEMTQFAAVSVAPDTVQLTPEDSTSATVLVQLSEAPEHVVEAAVGWASEECGRSSGEWADRSFTGGARRLSVTGSLSRIPVLCGNAPDEENVPFTSEWDYRLAAELRQPYFMSPRNNVTASAFVERQSEPQLFQRTAQGGRFALSRRLGSRELLTSAVDVEHRETQAAPALYCAAFAVCTPDDIAALGEARWRNALSANWLRDAGRPVVNPTTGYTARANIVWTTPLLVSDFDYLRSSVEGAIYRTVAPGWVLAGFLRAGTFITRAGIGTEDFVPPEDRFYAGGASSVRGYARSRLGPGIWLYEGDEVPVDTTDNTLDVAFYPTGGTSVAVASLEARFPSPFLDDLLDMAAFVDAGTVGYDPLWELSSTWRVTPGLGVRITTPVGPFRVDVAYNPYPQTRAPLYVQDFETRTIRRVTDSYRPADQSFLRRLQFHISLGQAF